MLSYRAQLNLLAGLLLLAASARGQTGPETEKRFPALIVPDGFKATLFACDPLVEYASVIALGPRPKTLFVAHDYMTGLGVEIVRRDEIRLLEDTDGDGYADKSSVFARGFNSIQGLASHGEFVYAMHAPLLTSVRDSDGDGVADERKDIVVGLGLPPEENDNRLHCANGVVVGHDGWLYLALGDRGCDVKRPEGDRLLFQQGGILRCRPDGTDLHVFSGGMRNIYDVALDDQLNVFVRDNENDGGDFMIRVCHSFHGADHGYPYLYYERPGEAMPPIADLGRGSSAGGVCYLEPAFPPQFHGSLFFCEWGRSVVRYPLDRGSSGFRETKEIQFAAAAESDPYGFKPTDAIVDRDGSLLISDWCDGQRPKRGRGRIYRLSWSNASPTEIPQDIFDQLDSPSQHVRINAQRQIARSAEGGKRIAQAIADDRLGYHGKLHAVWILAGEGELELLLSMAADEDDARVRAQCIKAIADLTDPIIANHRLDAGRGSTAVAEQLAKIAADDDPRVVLEAVVAMGRLRWDGAPRWLANHVRKPDGALAHAAAQTLRRCGNWPDVLQLLTDDSSDDATLVGEIAFRAVALQSDEQVVDGLIELVERDDDERRRGNYADALGRVYKRPEPWVYWGFRPAQRKPNTVAWSRTEPIAAALSGALRDRSHLVRQASLSRMLRERIAVDSPALTRWLNEDPSDEHAATMLTALRRESTDPSRDALERFVRNKRGSDANRLAALRILVTGLTAASEPGLLKLGVELEDGSVLARVIEELGQRPKLNANKLLVGKLDSRIAAVRTAAVAALSRRGADQLTPHLASLLRDASPEIRRAAALAAGELKHAASVDRLLELATDDSSPAVRGATLTALRRLSNKRAAALAAAALEHPESQLAALDYLNAFGDEQQLAALVAFAQTNRSAEHLVGAVRALGEWRDRGPEKRGELDRAIAEIHGSSGSLIGWAVFGPFDESTKLATANLDADSLWRIGTGIDATVSQSQPAADVVYFAKTEIAVAEGMPIEILASGRSLQLWLNGKSIHRRAAAGGFQPDSDRVQAALRPGVNEIVARVAAAGGAARWHVRFRAKASKAEHERLAAAALRSRGNVARGRELFLNKEKSLCLKCHRLGSEGASIGPDLTAVGRRFSRVHLVESLLEPSRSIAPSYATVAIRTTDGRLISGVKAKETDRVLTIGDREGKLHELAPDDIDELQVQKTSTMPDGIEKRLSEREFIDLIAFLTSQK